MTFQELGAIGELIGGLAVLLTLLYLAIQTKQARIAAEETANFAAIQAIPLLIPISIGEL